MPALVSNAGGGTLDWHPTAPSKESMTNKLKNFIQRIVSSPESESEHVHFHQGPQGHPAACHDPRCASPHLSI